MDLKRGTAGELTSGDVEVLAAVIHETWLRLAREEGWSMQPHLDKPYAELLETDKEDNRAAARRIPAVLSLVGLGLRKGKDGAPAAVPRDDLRAQLDQNIERLAEAEHDGWMAQRRCNGWRWAKTRNDPLRLHPAVLPYAELTEREKRKDRNSVRHYPDFATEAGYRIVPIG